MQMVWMMADEVAWLDVMHLTVQRIQGDDGNRGQNRNGYSGESIL